MCFHFSRKKIKVDALMVVEHSIKVQLETYVNHLQTVQLSYDIIIGQNQKIIKLLEEKNKE